MTETFEAIEHRDKRTYHVTYDDYLNRFIFTRDNGESDEFRFCYYCTLYGGFTSDFDPLSCSGIEQWRLRPGGYPDDVFITWKTEDQKRRIQQLVTYQGRNVYAKSLKTKMIALKTDLGNAEIKVNEAICVLRSRPALFVLCLPVCLERLKREHWLSIDLLRYLANFM